MPMSPTFLETEQANRTTLLQQFRDLFAPHTQPVPAHALPFAAGDTTVGAENELQAVVIGSAEQVDLPCQILDSAFYNNLKRRVESGDAPVELIERIHRFLDSCGETWSNSYLRVPLKNVKPTVRALIESDLLADKADPKQGKRPDFAQFFITKNQTDYFRTPVSYLLKLSLNQALADSPLPDGLNHIFQRYQHAFVSDNTSPEVLSFSPVHLQTTPDGTNALADETALRLFLCQLLMEFANKSFELNQHAQKAVLYMAPHVPVKQQELNQLIPDSFYRDLFMNPCLNGWDRGADKHQYMRLCHKVLSRSHLNVVAKLKDAGIVINNLVVLPNTSNASLATNGTHLSIGSQKLTAAIKSGQISEATEKYTTDLVSKIMEHFLPLFAVNFSAAPYRLDFEDFHPEKALGFLAHELDYTHLRMMWRRWRKKAKLNCFGYRLTPFGPLWLDRLVSRLFNLRGDYIPDYRLIDYFMTLLSTDSAPGLSGELGNDEILKKELAVMGVFDEQMSVYTLFRARNCKQHGFAGFEGRFYSLFPSLQDDLGPAVKWQNLLTALAYHYILNEGIDHDAIPDSPHLESERRQIFFDSAIGLPTFFIKKETKNKFLKRILNYTARTRNSHRYPGYIRVHTREYCLGLMRMIEHDGADLIRNLHMDHEVFGLYERLCRPKHESAAAKLTQPILKQLHKKHPIQAPKERFNLAAEAYYRTTLREAHFHEGLAVAKRQLRQLQGQQDAPELWRAIQQLASKDPQDQFETLAQKARHETASADELQQLILQTLCLINYHEINQGV